MSSCEGAVRRLARAAACRRFIAPGALLVLSLARNAAAHGPAPAALEPLVKRGDDLSLLRTNLGLARRRANGTYDYVCPSRWDGNELALAVANADGSRVLVHSAGVAWLSQDGGCAFEPLALDGEVRAAAALGGDTFVLLLHAADADALYDVAAERAFALVGSVDSMAAFASAVWIAGAKPAPFLRRIDVQAKTLEERSLDVAAERVTLAGGHGAQVWLALSRDGTSELVWTNGNALQATGLTSETRFGPVFWQERWWALLDGTLYASGAAGAGAVPALDPIAAVDWTCLQTLGKRAYACSLDGLFELESVGDGVPNLGWRFSFEQLGAPSECPNDDASCSQDWAHFAAESGWLDSTPSTEPGAPRVAIAASDEPVGEPSPKPSNGSCSARQGGERRGGDAFLVAALALVSAVRRRKVSDFRE